MPELPEVETVKNGLKPVMEGARLENVVIRTPKLRFNIPEDFTEIVTGTLVERLDRRSKYILIHLDNDYTIILHLGMSGRIRIYSPNDEAPEIGKHDHVSFLVAGGTHIIFTDPRRFGALLLVRTGDCPSHKLLKDIGPEPLGNEFNENVLRQGLKKRKSVIKTALLDQKLVAGLGNIYVCEALWRAHIDPERRSNLVSTDEITRLVPIIRQVLMEAIEAGGSTLKDFSSTDGELGYFQHSFKVYGREGECCSNESCGGTVIRILQANRSTFYCPVCQV